MRHLRTAQRTLILCGLLLLLAKGVGSAIIWERNTDETIKRESAVQSEAGSDASLSLVLPTNVRANHELNGEEATQALDPIISSPILAHLSSPHSEIRFSHTVHEAGSGAVYHHLQQRVWNIPLLGRDLVLAADRDGVLTHIYGTALSAKDLAVMALSASSVQAQHSIEEAIEALLQYLMREYYLSGKEVDTSVAGPAPVHTDREQKKQQKRQGRYSRSGLENGGHDVTKHWRVDTVWLSDPASGSLRTDGNLTLAHCIRGTFSLQREYDQVQHWKWVNTVEDELPVAFEACLRAGTSVDPGVETDYGQSSPVISFVHTATSIVSDAQCSAYRVALSSSSSSSSDGMLSSQRMVALNRGWSADAAPRGAVASLLPSRGETRKAHHPVPHRGEEEAGATTNSLARRLGEYETDVSLAILDKRPPHREYYRSASSTSLPSRHKDASRAVLYVVQGAHLIASLSNRSYLSYKGSDAEQEVQTYIHWKEFSSMVYRDVLVLGNGFVVDDIVATLLYGLYSRHISQYSNAGQSGALYYGLSYAFGESLDLLNTAASTSDKDDDGSSLHDVRRYAHLPSRCTNTDWQFAVEAAGLDQSTRWILGEGMRSKHLEKPVALFDLYYPECFGAPGSVYSDMVYCGIKDNGGVQTNAGIITRLFATLVDGGDYADPEDSTNTFLLVVTALGLTKTLNLFWRTQLALPSYADFEDFGRVLSSICRSNVGLPLFEPDITAGIAVESTSTLTSLDCDSVDVAINGAGIRTTWPC